MQIPTLVANFVALFFYIAALFIGVALAVDTFHSATSGVLVVSLDANREPLVAMAVFLLTGHTFGGGHRN